MAYRAHRCLGLAMVAALALAGCESLGQTVGEVAALQNLEVEVAGSRDEVLAGIPVDRLRNPGQLAARDALLLAAALRSRQLPLRLVIDVEASNPRDNYAAARLLGLDWRLVVKGREAVAGSLGAQPSIAPGASILIPVAIELDLARVFGDDLEELVRIAVAVSGYGERSDVDAALFVTPTVASSLGPLRYPGEIRISLD